jgi:putative hemin transport protein
MGIAALYGEQAVGDTMMSKQDTSPRMKSQGRPGIALAQAASRQGIIMLQDSQARIRAAVEANPRKMTMQLASELGVPEAEVIRAFPPQRAVELDINRWEELIQCLEEFGSVRVIVSSGCATVEVEGQFGGFSKTGHFFNVQTSTLDMHIRWKEFGAVFAVEKPGHQDGVNTLSIQFYDKGGSAGFKVFLNFGEAVSAEKVQAFATIREQFRKAK